MANVTDILCHVEVEDGIISSIEGKSDALKIRSEC